MHLFFDWLNRNRDVGIFMLRLFIGAWLIYGVLDNIISWQRMIEFRQFLRNFHFPLPLASAIISVYAQFIAGILFLFGWKMRYAALLMIINFLIAFLMVHRGDQFAQMTAPLTMIFCSLLFLFYGAGKISIDKWLQKK